ncbi:hypothetical protein HU200_004506 [Digitaria exilis]|uniref:MATH domain-containing protein n=1 Tax=Digitaria exilis TaxID=1010633 RepID=A0A835KXC6_9POAL|nr:hypothetical protein HU200_004506 [Digitaria exilis]
MASYSNAAATASVIDGSSSTVTTEVVTGWHVLNINRYSQTKGHHGVGKSFKSSTFTVGGHRWHIDYYADGYDVDDSDCICFDLVLENPSPSDDAAVKAGFVLALLDGSGEPVPEYTRILDIGTFSEAVPSWGFERFIEREELENSPYLAGDSFSVRCDVTVYKEINGAETAAGGVELVGTAAAEENVVVAPGAQRSGQGDDGSGGRGRYKLGPRRKDGEGARCSGVWEAKRASFFLAHPASSGPVSPGPSRERARGPACSPSLFSRCQVGPACHPLPRAVDEKDLTSSPCAARLRRAFPLRKPRFPAFISTAPTPLVFQPKAVASAATIAAPFRSRRRRFELVVKVRPLIPLSLALSRPRRVAAMAEPPLRRFCSTPAKRRRAPPSPAASAAAVEPSDLEPLDRDPTAEIEPDSSQTEPQNGPFEGDQDQVYEEEPPQYFEEGNDLDEF